MNAPKADQGINIKKKLMPFWWVGWWCWRAGCISQDTYLLYKFKVLFPISKLNPPFNIVIVNDQILAKADNPELVMFSWKLRTNQTIHNNNPNLMIIVFFVNLFFLKL